MRAVLAEEQKLILNKSLVELDDPDEALLCKRLKFSETPNQK